MTATHDRGIHLAIPAEADSLLRVRQVVAELASALPPEAARRVLLAVHEAATNVVVHAYHDRPTPGPLIVSARIRDARLSVEVCDQGSGARPRHASPGMGAGMRVMAALCTSMQVEHQSQGTRVRMQFHSHPPAHCAA